MKYDAKSYSDNAVFQIVWADSEAVGCGVNLCQEIWVAQKNEWFENAYLVVCDYGPG